MKYTCILVFICGKNNNKTQRTTTLADLYNTL